MIFKKEAFLLTLFMPTCLQSLSAQGETNISGKVTDAGNHTVEIINDRLSSSVKTLNEVIITGKQRQTNTMDSLDISKIRLLSDASGGNLEALLVTFAGVNSNNELSSQYSVRGGNYDENLVYVNGTEVYRPLLIRAGQQEGLSFVNPEMVKNVKFSAGGFEARFGDKMSSVLDIQYKKPEKPEIIASISLLGANVYAGTTSKNGKFTQIHGLRYKTNAYLLGTLDTKGEYHPSFLDYQTQLTYRPSPSIEWSFLGNFSKNSYQFKPRDRETDFGTYMKRFHFKVYFDGQERDLFQTAFAALTLDKMLKNKLKLSLQTAFFQTAEEENYDITGQYWLRERPINHSEANTANNALLGVGTYHEHARNRLTANVFNLSQQGKWKTGQHEAQWGLTYQQEHINDHLKEWEMRDSAGYALPRSHTEIRLTRSMHSQVNMKSFRFMGFFQDTWRLRKKAGIFVFTGGLRGNDWNFNQEMFFSPRASVAFFPARKKNLTFRFASGIYCQAPFYKELRDTATTNGITQIEPNRKIKAQKTIHYVAGMDYHFVSQDRPFKLTAEAYYKDMSHLIPYTVDNVRIRYDGRNRAEGYTAGLDMKLFGEFVPGTDSWICISLMKSRETIDHLILSRPNEQRYNISLFFQDYFPGYPQFTINLKVVWADGLPFGPPDSGKSDATLRMPPYRRVDIGLSKIIQPDRLKHFKKIWIGVDCFNLLDLHNVNSYYWITDIDHSQWAIPNYLTGRRFNIRLTAEL
ncbi:MAG: TonB-dependent receptor plug domain-containing protein [Bacteroidales bacterium]|nr:TonB-dependent receptor plug domain-containing protein [Bacteroidales bacterium]